MLRKIWNWLERNSSQLQGLAAVAAIVAALAAIPFFLTKWLQPELTVQVTADPSSMPPALEAWTEQAARALRRLPTPSQNSTDPFADLRELQSTGPLEGRRADYSLISLSPAILRIDVANHTDRVIPGVRLRIDRARPSWGLSLAATFLTTDEVVAWQEAVPSASASRTFVLPELPALPPNSAVTVVAYGDVADAAVSVTVPDAVFKVVETVQLEDKGLVALILRPYWFPPILSLAALAIVLALVGFARSIARRTRRDATYDLACLEARAGRRESALALLEEALRLGYDKFEHMRRDPDLDSLREVEAFKRLIVR